MKLTACLRSAEPVDEELWEAFLDRLEEYTPRLELESPGTAYLEAAGMDGLYGSWAAWSGAVLAAADSAGLREARLGIAAGYLAARLAAEYSALATRWHRVAEADRAYLARFPLDTLPLAAEPRRRMGLLGINSLGQLARLSARAVAEQFGPDVLPYYRLACGAGTLRQVREVSAACSFDLWHPPASRSFWRHCGRVRSRCGTRFGAKAAVRHITPRAGWRWQAGALR